MRKPAQLLLFVGIVAVAALAATQLLFFYRDNFGTHYPIKTISADVFRGGEIPYWNFFDGGGQPLAGNPNTLTFYPDNVLYLFLPAHVAFNFHFLLHLILGFLAMRALTRSTAAAWIYAVSGIAVSATAFYNLITAIALVPFAFFAAERRSPLLLGAAFGLLVLGSEPVTILATALGVAILVFRRMRVRELAVAAGIAVVIALPQLIAYSEIAGEVERGVHRYSARTVLNASLEPKRIAELAIAPMKPLLNDRYDERFFSTIFLGMIAVPAMMRRSRYTWLVLILLFFALGRYNPVVAYAVEHFERLRVLRFPEKLALPISVALVALIARELDVVRRYWGVAAAVPVAFAAYDLGSWQLVIVSIALAMAAVLMLPTRQAMLILTFVPLVYWGARAAPVDWLTHYRVEPRPMDRVYVQPLPPAGQSAREEYRARAERLEPLFGAVAGLRYGVDRSPDGMFSVLSRIAAERFAATREERYLRIAGCHVPGRLPRAFVVGNAVGVRTIAEAVQSIERGSFDERQSALAPPRYNGFRSAAGAKVTRLIERGQTLQVSVSATGPVLLFVNESYFRGWVARANGKALATIPLDLDRLGVLVPGNSEVTLQFGRHRNAVAITWILSALLLIYVLDRGARQVQRAADEDRPLL